MNYLIEIIFENVFFDAIGQLIRELTQAGKNITNYSLNADWEMEDKIDWHSADSINRALNKGTTGWSFFINLSELNIIKPLSIKNCSIQILQYDSKYDVGINFNWEDICLRDSTDVTETLMTFSRKMAFKYGIRHYFAGLEPACDEETRLFTHGRRGPLNLPTPSTPSWKEETFVSQVGYG
jgi:hypothetical protein